MASKKKQVATLFQFYFVSLTHPETEQDLLFSSSSPDEAVTTGEYEQLQERRFKAILSAVVFHQKDYVKYLIKFNK